jgi:hypothetical protein
LKPISKYSYSSRLSSGCDTNWSYQTPNQPRRVGFRCGSPGKCSNHPRPFEFWFGSPGECRRKSYVTIQAGRRLPGNIRRCQQSGSHIGRCDTGDKWLRHRPRGFRCETTVSILKGESKIRLGGKVAPQVMVDGNGAKYPKRPAVVPHNRKPADGTCSRRTRYVTASAVGVILALPRPHIELGRWDLLPQDNRIFPALPIQGNGAIAVAVLWRYRIKRHRSGPL